MSQQPVEFKITVVVILKDEKRVCPTCDGRGSLMGWKAYGSIKRYERCICDVCGGKRYVYETA